MTDPLTVHTDHPEAVYGISHLIRVVVFLEMDNLEFCVVMSEYDFRIQMMFGSS
jgi:hypothetical protein